MDTATEAPAQSPAPQAGQAGPTPGATSEALRSTHDAVVNKHANAGKFQAGRTPWNKGVRMAPGENLEQDTAPASGPAYSAGVSPGVAPAAQAPTLVDQESVKRIVSLAVDALDKTLQTNLAVGWYHASGDKDLALQQAEFYALKRDQREAIGECAGLVAKKYQAALQYLPEFALTITLGGYLIGWLTGFTKLKQALALKAQSLEKEKK